MSIKIKHIHHTKGETIRRSMVKAITWRAVASLDTMIISYFVTSGDIKKAVAIAGFEVITKTIIYFLHERGWNKIRWGKKIEDLPHIKTADTKVRSIVKATTWRLLGTLDTFIISNFFTKSLKLASSIALIELITKPILYFFHERFWNNVVWGKREFKQMKSEKEN